MRAHWTGKGYTVEEVSAEDPQAVLYALDTPSLFGDGRFVVVRGDAKRLEEVADRLADWAATPPPGIAAALVVGSAAKLRKALASSADILELEAPKPWAVSEWLQRFLKSRNRTMTKDAATALVEAVGTDLRELASAAEQLTLATTGTIGVDTVARLFRGVESQLYTFLDAVVKRDRPAALRHLGSILRAEHPLVVLSALAKQFRALAVAPEAGRTPPAALAKDLDVTVGYVNRAVKHFRNFTGAEVRRAFGLLAEADFALKGGERGEDLPGELVLETLVADICGASVAPVARHRAR